LPERFLVVMPTYNESRNLGDIVPQVLTQDPRLEVLVVDDNSPDGTGEIADRLAGEHVGRVHVLHRELKEGLGRAYLAGFRWALDREYARVFEMDADRSHDPRYLRDLIATTDTADLALGSRYLTGVNVINWPMSRLLLSYLANFYVRWITGMPLTDATGGFKCFRRQVLEKIPLAAIKSDGYVFQIEMSFRAWKLGFSLVEVPIIFTDRVAGQSKMTRKVVREAVWMVWWLRIRHLFGKL
jgi:dolichol-phosphate mannosyltransferase